MAAGRRLVYSSGPAGSGPAEEQPRAAAPASPPAAQRIRTRLERKGRGGKTVTVAGPFAPPRDAVRALLKRLAKECGCGGAVKPVPGAATFEVELQGDHVERVRAALGAAGYRV